MTGDPAKATELLGGKTPELVLAHANTELRTQQAEAIRKSLTERGFTITMKSIESSSYYDEVGRKDNPYDLYLGGWGADWPTGSTVVPPLYDGRGINTEGNQNLSYLNDPGVSAEVDRIRQLPATEQDTAWMALDERIMRDLTPVVPLYYDVAYVLHGSRIGNAFLSDAFGNLQVNTIFVKP